MSWKRPHVCRVAGAGRSCHCQAVAGNQLTSRRLGRGNARRGRGLRRLLLALSFAAISGCAGKYDQALDRDLRSAEGTLELVDAGAASGGETAQAPELGSEASYLAVVLRESPELRAAFERWRAARERIDTTRRLPEPTISFAYFLRSVETRVGPQRAKLSLAQSFPWPGQYEAAANAASAQARVKQRHFEANALMLRERVARAYWRLWFVRRAREIHREHLEIVRGLSETILGRLSTGAATLADQQQVDLRAARLTDAIASFDDREAQAAAALRASCGLEPAIQTPTTQDAYAPELPVPALEELAESLPAHPMIESFDFAAEAAEHRARAERSKRLPGFALRADWIITGDAVMPGTDQSGQDAVAVGAGVRVPLWQRAYSGGVDAAEAEGRASRADREAALDRAQAQLKTQFSEVRESARRIDLYEGTLIPQAAAAYDSLLGGYAVGRATLAQTLLAQREWLELRIELEQARAEHAQAWAALEFVYGGPIEGRAVTARELMSDADTQSGRGVGPQGESADD
mgnify:CR=1 FL=1